MKFREITEIQKSGAFNVDKSSNMQQAIVGGVALTAPMCDQIAFQIGWTGRRSLPSYQLIDKANSYIKSLQRYIKNERLGEYDVMFENIRVNDSLKTFDRIVFSLMGNSGVSKQFTIIHGMAGLGGSYALFDASVSQAQPVIASRSIREVCEELSMMV